MIFPSFDRVKRLVELHRRQEPRVAALEVRRRALRWMKNKMAAVFVAFGRKVPSGLEIKVYDGMVKGIDKLHFVVGGCSHLVLGDTIAFGEPGKEMAAQVVYVNRRTNRLTFEMFRGDMNNLYLGYLLICK
jgi:hypothetical protein